MPLAHSRGPCSRSRGATLRAFDGTATIQQPLIAPLYKGKSAHELLALLLGRARPDPAGDRPRLLEAAEPCRAISRRPGERRSKPALIAGTALKPKAGDAAGQGGRRARSPVDERLGGLEIVFRPDPTVWDGRFANNGWLQELPKPLTKLSWDNAALVSPALARRLGRRERRRGRADVSRPLGADSGLDHARSGRRIDHGVPRARPPARRPGRDRGRRRRVWAAHARTSLGSAADSKSSRRPASAAGWRPCITISAWKDAT